MDRKPDIISYCSEGAASATPIRLQSTDGVSLGGFLWSHGDDNIKRAVVVISAATSVRCRYYERFANYLFANGFDVITYDYRGIGESRPASLRGFSADWVDWGEGDLETILQFTQLRFQGQPIYAVGHSIGGFAIGLAPSNMMIQRVFTVGAQFAYWRDYSAKHRTKMFVKWHIVMPTLTKLLGYFPGKILGWMEDTPNGVVHNWSHMKPRFEDTVRQNTFIAGKRKSELLQQRFTKVTAPTLAIGLSDDPHGTPKAVDRLLAYFTQSPRQHWQITPEEISVDTIGHFAFFHDRFKDNLWPIALGWLQSGMIPNCAPGRLISQSDTQTSHRQ